MAMNPAEIAAYIGAAAWLPQIGTLLYRRYIVPTIAIIPEKQAEIGFTIYGPIFNLRVALAVERKDVILDSIGIEITHENGDKRVFSWAGMTETFSEVKDESGVRQVFEKNQSAIALKLSTVVLTERFIRFQSPIFHEKLKPILNDALAHRAYLENKGENYQEEFLKSKQIHDMLEHFRKEFCWKAGEYRLRFVATSPSKVAVANDTFGFELSQYDVDVLAKNLQELKTDFEHDVKQGISGYEGRPGHWLWRNPVISKI